MRSAGFDNANIATSKKMHQVLSIKIEERINSMSKVLATMEGFPIKALVCHFLGKKAWHFLLVIYLDQFLGCLWGLLKQTQCRRFLSTVAISVVHLEAEAEEDSRGQGLL